MTEPATLSESHGISMREAEILELLGEHLTNAEISARLYISVRTVESHVSSLLRKLEVSDRRALAELSPGLSGDGDATTPRVVPQPPPSPLTSFVGRVTERAALVEALDGQRLVTAVGPGGVGKTRLALAVAADVATRFSDGVWYVDLVPVTDPAMIASAIAAALGLGEQPGRTVEHTVIARLADAEALLVLDNCEHLVADVVVLVERLLAASSRLTVLATSRARLQVPFERVFPVSGLSLTANGADDGEPGDAVALFAERAAAAGMPPLSADDRRRVAAICRGLDGMALAIELAAARLPTLGLDGLEAGLADRLRLLTGGPRLDDRHSSLRAALDWSYALLSPADQAVLRRVSVFAAPFRPEDAAAVAGFTPIETDEVAEAIARLADQSLLGVMPGPTGTRYRALETIRQYGVTWLDEADEQAEARCRHLTWCVEVAAGLEQVPLDEPGKWRTAFDAAADDLRAALGWASEQPAQRRQAAELAASLAGLAYRRGMATEAQRRYEQVAALTEDPATAAMALYRGAGAANARNVGNDALRLHRQAADAALRAGDPDSAVLNLALSATLINRGPGLIADLPEDGTVEALLAEAWDLVDRESIGPGFEAALLTAEAFNHEELDPRVDQLIERAAELSLQSGDPLIESAALDWLTAVQLARGEIREAAASAQRRIDLIAPLAPTAELGFELPDAYQMAADTSVAVGDLPAARRFAQRILELPFYREEGHLANARLLIVEAMAGNWDVVLTASQRFAESWERAGRPRIRHLAAGASAVAMVHGLRGDDAARTLWLERVVGLRWEDRHDHDLMGYAAIYETLVMLHRGELDQAMSRLAAAPQDLNHWWLGMWRHWYAALWAETAVLLGHPDAADRLDQAPGIVAGNPIAAAMVERAEVLAGRSTTELAEVAQRLDAAGAHYQAARTLVLAGGDARLRGEAILQAMGAAPMTVGN